VSELQRNAKSSVVKNFKGTKGIQKLAVSTRPGNSLAIPETINQWLKTPSAVSKVCKTLHFLPEMGTQDPF